MPKHLVAQDPVVDTLQVDRKSAGREKAPWKARPFPMKQVRLGNGPLKAAMEADQRFLHELPHDRLLHTFRINAGIPSSAEPLGGWEGPDCELRGHFAGGHYLSAVALMYASAQDEDLKKRGGMVVGELAKCQKSLNNGGYLSAFPIEFFDRLRNREKVWAPFYTIHKIMAGLLNMYLY
ncbi:MAG: glycoside hydrolase family 127 protein, partial [Acidobacteria bacterium]|nr:glycoside hydrolase family 127 protein [Acidobacteriota bacterium]